MEAFEIILLCVLGAALLFALLFFAALYYIYRRTFYCARGEGDPFEVFEHSPYREHKDGMIAMMNELLAHPFEEVTVESHDGITLYARYYHVADGAPVDIECHGYRGAAIRDFCGGARLSRELGHNILLIDERASGKSGGHTTTFGIKERHDVLTWANYIAKRFGEDTKIYLFGISMGAATVVMARTLPLPRGVVGIFADCPYDKPYNIIKKVVGTLGYPVEATMKLMCLSAKVFGKFDLGEYDCLRAVREKSEIPVYLVHGKADDFVPASMSERIYNENPDAVRLLLIDGADHGMSFVTDPVRYRAYVDEFLKEGN